jgi:tyrosyl-tRNA synthetase
MYGKVMSISDQLMWRYWELLTDTSMESINSMRQQAESGRINPMQIKKGLAAKIVADFHSEAAAKQAMEDWERQFQRDEVPEQLEQVAIPYAEVAVANAGQQTAVKLDKLLARAGMADSVSDGLRKIKAKAVRIDGKVHSEPLMTLTIPAEFVVRVGRLMKKISVQNHS